MSNIPQTVDPYAAIATPVQPVQSGAPSATAPDPYASIAQPIQNTTTPSALNRAGTGVLQGIQEVAAPVTPQDHKEALVSFIGGPGALVAYKSGKALVNSVENILKPPAAAQIPPASAYQNAVKEFHNTLEQFKNKDYRNAGSSAVSGVADLATTMPGPGTFLGPQVKDISEGLRPGADLVGPLAKDVTKDVLLGGTVVAPELAEGEATEAAPKFDHVFNPDTGKIEPYTEDLGDTAKQTQVIKATTKSKINSGSRQTVAPSGENIQPNLHDSIRDFINKTHADNDLPPVAKDVSVLDAPQSSADAFQSRSQAAFDKVEKITGVNPTTLKEIMSTRADKIEEFLAAGKDEEAGSLQQLQLNDENRMAKAFNDAKTADPTADIDRARSDWNKSLRADELSNAVRGSKSNLSTIAKPDIDPNKLTSRLQKLYESQPGGKTAKLTQLGGDDNATTFVEQAENARDATRAIKEFVPTSATGQHALAKIIEDNTTETAGLLGKTSGKTDWSGVVKDLGNLKSEEGRAAFGDEFAKVRQYAGRQAAKQLALRIFFGGSPAEKLAKAGGVGYVVNKIL